MWENEPYAYLKDKDGIVIQYFKDKEDWDEFERIEKIKQIRKRINGSGI